MLNMMGLPELGKWSHLVWWTIINTYKVDRTISNPFHQTLVRIVRMPSRIKWGKSKCLIWPRLTSWKMNWSKWRKKKIISLSTTTYWIMDLLKLRKVSSSFPKLMRWIKRQMQMSEKRLKVLRDIFNKPVV